MAVNFQSEEEVKDYLEKIGIEYRFGCFSEKNPEVCHMLGDYLESIKKDYEKASKLYRSNCDDYGYGKSCLKYGNYTFLGRGRTGEKGSPEEAFKYYEKGCTKADGDSCLHSGLMLVSKPVDNSGMKRDFPKGVEYLHKGCDLNNATACFYLSGMHISGAEEAEGKSTKSISDTKPKIVDRDGDFKLVKDMAKAFTFAYKACELKNMYACANLSQMYARGEGVEKNDEKAAKYKKIAVDMQDDYKKDKSNLSFQQM